MGERLRGGPVDLALAGLRELGDDVQAFAARRLAEGDEAELLEALAHLERGVDHAVERHVRRGVEIEHEAAGQLRIVRQAVPGMQLERGDLRRLHERFDAIDLQIGLAIARRLAPSLKRFDVPRMAWRWKNVLAVDAIGRANDGAGAAADVLDQPVADGFEVAREIELGDGLAGAIVGPERFAPASRW